MNTRREFLNALTVTAASAALPNLTFVNGFNGTLCLFSKHLPQLNWQQLGQTVKNLGFGGVDVTVRPQGHVLPERAAEDLPKAVAAIREAGLTVPMITTGLLSAGEPTAKPILQTAGKLRIPYCKPGYYKYAFVNVRNELDKAMKDFTSLAELSQECGVQLGFHNHESYIGAPLWDVAPVIDSLQPKWVGYYFDIRHAVAEGGGAGWKIALNLVAPRLKMIAIKDSYPEKTSKGWTQKDCPLGEGAVNWKAYFQTLKQANFHGPVSLHIEYDITGKTPSERDDNTLVAIQRDLAFLKARVQEAYGA
ncbi:MAG TPA: sugar phosphate isomerase/epimerase family protein [Blastocatellia bacterium]|nr:sugar phosphate isomerase/epimerase family protein [Blastocatellia bacterium]